MSNDAAVNSTLFNYCNALTGTARAPASGIPSRDAKDYQWLREALQSVESPERRVKALLATVANREEKPTEERCDALEELSDMVEDINWATEFSLMDGHNIILNQLKTDPAVSESADLRKGLTAVLASASQQHERVQLLCEESKWADVILPLLKQEKKPDVLAALLHSCSCICRQCEPASASFVRGGGMDILSGLLKADNQSIMTAKLYRRTLFLIAYFAEIGISSEGIVEGVCRCASAVDDEFVVAEAARALSSLAEKGPKVVKAKMMEMIPEVYHAWVQLPAVASRSAPEVEDDQRVTLMRRLEC